MNVLGDLLTLGERVGVDLALRNEGKAEHVALRIDPDGNVLDLEVLKDHPIRCPWPVNRTSSTAPNLLYDNASYILGIGDKKNDRLPAAKRLHERLLQLAPKNKGAKAVVSFFSKKPPKNKKVLEAVEKRDLVFYLGNSHRPICEDPNLHGAIDTVLREGFTTQKWTPAWGDEDECVLSVHGKLSLVGLGNPQALITYDKPVTQILGVKHEKRMLHAPMGYAAMRRVTGALEWLNANRRLSTPSTSGKTLSYFGWADTDHRIEAIVKRVLFGPEKGLSLKDWRDWLEATFDGDSDLFSDPTPYHLLEVACASRIAVRGYHVLTVSEVATRIRAFVDDFSFRSQTGRVRAKVSPYIILKQLKSTPSVSLVERLYDAIFLGRAYPREMLTTALTDYTHAASRGEYPGLSEALLNAYTNRSNPMLENNQNPHYLCGRLFAVLEQRARKAKSKGDRSSMSRWLKQVVQYPAVTFPRLLTLSHTHALKLEGFNSRKEEGVFSRRTFHAEVSEIMGLIEQAGGFPRTAKAEDQLKFHMGHMAEWRRYREENSARWAEIEAAAEEEAVEEKGKKKAKSRKKEPAIDPEGV